MVNDLAVGNKASLGYQAKRILDGYLDQNKCQGCWKIQEYGTIRIFYCPCEAREEERTLRKDVTPAKKNLEAVSLKRATGTVSLLNLLITMCQLRSVRSLALRFSWP